MGFRENLLTFRARSSQGSTQQPTQFLTSLMVLPYLYPAYGLFHLATSLQVGFQIPEWYQLIRAAVVVTAKVEDLVSLCCDVVYC